MRSRCVDRARAWFRPPRPRAAPGTKRFAEELFFNEQRPWND
ncbi:MAG: hypothetical protein AVDCRST_MAG91-3572 [uncultured Sphingomonadaceae bacterium]|uniref:Uncharacterized protein n=1 Tax=uncultured Sphingomonadaceae bacterium TaxID=169976 RepID=A0A6J4U3Z6_9SPHN|nr:MAG: hypothetical protein AVDCRST_MAG91-3572 [uncultured Sphingomonadaceae bacterium]